MWEAPLEPLLLEQLRNEARDELSAVIEIKCRQGEDPWDFLPDLPSVDEQVVATIRAERLADARLTSERARAHHPASPRGAAEAFEYKLLRSIALEHPELSTAVWGVLARLPHAA
ncbi:hypothetical protein [Orlajensenia leifsoniae]|jgi:hypothetical protein|uniref:Tryptophan synthase subunit alpha n=1 Tax=Orlajensenia leifsoniae TaxID=2561933 RepID=A0A4Y9R5S3_9MICO|nr:hypothetical protein [Leifsonia flava]TFV99690.1 hypothetical protein E4M00_00335 [Leifsonia flava]